MKEWTEELLLADGYKLQNAEITNVSLNFRDHGVLSLDLTLNGGGWGVVYGGYALGHGYLGAKHLNAFPVKMQKVIAIWITRILSTWKTININALPVELART